MSQVHLAQRTTVYKVSPLPNEPEEEHMVSDPTLTYSSLFNHLSHHTVPGTTVYTAMCYGTSYEPSSKDTVHVARSCICLLLLNVQPTAKLVRCPQASRNASS